MLDILKKLRENFDNIKADKTTTSSDSKEVKKEPETDVKKENTNDISSQLSEIKNPNNIVFYGMIGVGIIIILIIAVIIYNFIFSSSTTNNTQPVASDAYADANGQNGQNGPAAASSIGLFGPVAASPIGPTGPMGPAMGPTGQMGPAIAAPVAAAGVTGVANEIYENYKATTVQQPSQTKDPYYELPTKQPSYKSQKSSDMRQDPYYNADNIYTQPRENELTTIRSKSKSLFDNFYTKTPTIIPESQKIKSVAKSSVSKVDIPTLPSKTTEELNEKTEPSSLASFFSFSTPKKETEEEKPKITGGKKSRRKYTPRKK
jgi:hypothetical protein